MRILALILGLSLFNDVDAKQKFYKWTDAEGNIHYSEKKPENQSTSEVKINTSQPNVPNNNHNNTPAKQENIDEGDERTPEQKAVDEFNQQEQARVNAIQNRENCKVAQKNYATLQKTVRVRQKSPTTGEYIRMDSDERLAMLEKAKQSIEKLCR